MTPMLVAIAPNIWHTTHEFVTNGIRISSRMTVVRLNNGNLWLHSPVPISTELKFQITTLGNVAFIVAPNKMHHLFALECMAVFPQARCFGAPGLLAKRPDLLNMRELSPSAETDWQDDLDQIFFAGIPLGNETVWFHRSSRTLIVTDLLQFYQGHLSFGAKVYAHLTGTRNHLAVPKILQWMIKDRPAARTSAQKILDWPFERVVVAHNSIIDTDAHSAVEKAFASFN